MSNTMPDLTPLLEAVHACQAATQINIDILKMYHDTGEATILPPSGVRTILATLVMNKELVANLTEDLATMQDHVDQIVTKIESLTQK